MTAVGRCAICNESRMNPYFEGGNDLQQCAGCGVVFDTRNIFDQNYYENERASQIDERKMMARKRNVAQRGSLIRPFLNKEMALLDISCGEGLFLQEVHGFVGNVSGLEPTHFYAS
jgi:2-polyprenyl-3-methyl-5-hydroxy-6-metoxy-1,4-benzoquinol methylase